MRQFAEQFFFFGLFITLGAYYLSEFIKRKLKWSLLNPLLLSIILLIALLVATDIPYSTYIVSAGWLNKLLTPVTVCLAIPLYRQLGLLKQHTKAILAGISAGVLVSFASVFLLAKLLAVDHTLMISLLPKSVTTAIGIGLSEEMGGIVTITVASIIITGLFGNMAGVMICKLFRLSEPVAVGIAFGTASHVIGTVRAMEIGEVQGAMSSLAVSVAGICTVPIMVVLVPLLPS